MDSRHAARLVEMSHDVSEAGDEVVDAARAWASRARPDPEGAPADIALSEAVARYEATLDVWRARLREG